MRLPLIASQDVYCVAPRLAAHASALHPIAIGRSYQYAHSSLALFMMARVNQYALYRCAFAERRDSCRCGNIQQLHPFSIAAATLSIVFLRRGRVTDGRRTSPEQRLAR